MSAPAVAGTRDGKVAACAWMDERTGKRDRKVYWTRSTPTGFEPDSRIDPDSSLSEDHPAVVFDDDGVLWAAWEGKDGAGQQAVRVRSTAPGSKPLQASDDSHGKAAFPALASRGKMTCLVHESGRRGEEIVVFRRLE